MLCIYTLKVEVTTGLSRLGWGVRKRDGRWLMAFAQSTARGAATGMGDPRPHGNSAGLRGASGQARVGR